MNPKRSLVHLARYAMLIWLVISLTGCAIKISPASEPVEVPSPPIPSKNESSELVPVTFQVNALPKPDGEVSISLDILDDLTGSMHNVQRYTLTPQGENLFLVTTMLPNGGIIHYRYSQLTPIEVHELDAQNKPVSFRSAIVYKDLVIKDTIFAWPQWPYIGETGMLHGIASDKEMDKTVPDALVTVAGLQTLTDMTGRFSLDNVPAGVHNLVVTPLDGSHLAYQQEINIVPGLSTPAVIKLRALKPVKVTFVVTPPDDAVGAPIRLAGNLYQTGFTFSDRSSGVSPVASRMPLMTRQEDGTYSLTLELFAGTDLRYKYTIGDGYVNAERAEDGSLPVRRFIVPENDITVKDVVVAWRKQGAEPATINVTVPANTPPEDTVSIQFEHNTWLDPIPMWPLGNNQWMYLLYTDPMDEEPYRFRICRNDLCEVANDPVSYAQPYTVDLISPTNNHVVVESWNLWHPEQYDYASATPITVNGLRGVEFINDYSPSFLNRYLAILDELVASGINWIILTPTWKVETEKDLPYIKPNPAESLLIHDLEILVRTAKDKGMQVGLYPQLTFETNISDFWNQGTRTKLWWQQWFAEYEKFIYNYALFARDYPVDHFIVGGYAVQPSLPYGLKDNGDQLGTPDNAEDLWTQLLGGAKQYISGQMLWTVPIGNPTLPGLTFYNKMDGFYLEMGLDPAEGLYFTEATVGAYLDSVLLPFWESQDKLMYLGLNAASLTTFSADTASDMQPVSPITEQYGEANVDLEPQYYFYETYLYALIDRGWIQGVSARGFFPIVKLTDYSSSIYGKPAQHLLGLQ